MPPKFDFAHTNQLESIELLTARPSRIDFDTGDGLRFVVEAHAPGVYRIRCGLPHALVDEKPSPREKAIAEMLLARQEAVGEATIAPRDGGGWRIVQGETALEVLTDPVRVALFKGDAQVFISDDSEHAPGFGHNALDEPDEAVWTAGFALDASDRI
ncbi:MAG TPA: glycoside hydrolase family 31 protein, partial [Bordetella sp.]|nr:glycoside hydrolase family 31 protein [Bordetella sp.]